jgi:uncharacterized membrane protein YbaN (DUF454 family)
LIRAVYLACGFVSLTAGLVGIAVPLLPTTPLLLLAAYFFSRSSARLHNWLLQHRQFGPPIRQWRQYRVIPLRAKWLAFSMIGLALLRLVVLGDFAAMIKVAIAAVGIVAILFISSCPSVTPRSQRPGD